MPGRGPNKRLLVADDNPDSLDSLVMLLEGRGAECLSARTGKRALALAMAEEPEVVLLDISMPGLDGAEVCRRIRGTEWGKRALIIAISGWTGEQHRRNALGAGCDHYLSKPVDLGLLYRLIGI